MDDGASSPAGQGSSTMGSELDNRNGPGLSKVRSPVLGSDYEVSWPLNRRGSHYAGVQLSTGRRVAIQLISDCVDVSDVVQRFRAASRLRHPATVRIVDVGVTHGARPVGFVIRDYVDGHNLEQELARCTTLDQATSFRIIGQVLRSLCEAHRAGVVHGRLAPDQILLATNLANEHQVYVTGYGNGHSEELQLGYAAPEVHQFGQYHAQSDIYSAAAVLKRCLFGAEEFESQLWVNEERWVRFGPLLARALAADPRERFSGAAAMLEALCALEWSFDAGASGDKCLFGATVIGSGLAPEHHRLMASRGESIWVLDDDPALREPEVVQGLALCTSRFQVKRLRPAERESALAALRSGLVAPPSVMVFGCLTALLREPLLELLASCAETKFVCVASQRQLGRIQATLDFVGLDACVVLPCEPLRVYNALERAGELANLVTAHYAPLRAVLAQGPSGVATL